jgi:hypothetical protein
MIATLFFAGSKQGNQKKAIGVTDPDLAQADPYLFQQKTYQYGYIAKKQRLLHRFHNEM